MNTWSVAKHEALAQAEGLVHPDFAAKQPTPDPAQPGSAGDPDVMVTAEDDENTWHAQVFRCGSVPSAVVEGWH